MVAKNTKNKKTKPLKKKPTKVTKSYKTKPKAKPDNDYRINFRFTTKGNLVNTSVDTLGFKEKGKRANQLFLTYLAVGVASVLHNIHVKPDLLNQPIKDMYDSFTDNDKKQKEDK